MWRDFQSPFNDLTIFFVDPQSISTWHCHIFCRIIWNSFRSWKKWEGKFSKNSSAYNMHRHVYYCCKLMTQSCWILYDLHCGRQEKPCKYIKVHILLYIWNIRLALEIEPNKILLTFWEGHWCFQPSSRLVLILAFYTERGNQGFVKNAIE